MTVWAILFSQIAACSFFNSTYTIPKMLSLSAVLFVCSWRESRESLRSWPWIFFLASFAMTTATSFCWPLSLCGVYLAGPETALLAVLCFLAYREAQSSSVETVLDAGAAAAAVAAIASVAMESQTGRLAGPIGQAARFGTYLSIGSAMAMSSSWPWRTIPFILGAMAATGSRGALVATAAAALYLHGRKIPAWAVVSVAVCSAFVWFEFGAFRAYDSARFDLARAAWSAFLHHPWVGWGPGNFMVSAPGVDQVHAHFLPLNILATQGLLGASAWLVIGLSAWRGSGRAARAAYIAAGVCACFNPLPEASYVTLAVLFGASQKGWMPPRMDWPRAITATVIAAAVVAGAVADREARLAEGGGPTAALHWSRAHRANPLEIYYFARAVPR